MSLTPLVTHKTLSEKRLLEAFNEALVTADANFVYTLGQVASPVPSLSGVPEDYVLAVNQANALEYKNVSSLIDLQAAFSSYLTDNSKVTLNNSLEFSLAKAAFPFAEFSVTGRNPNGTGSINNYVSIKQLSNSGQLDEDHSVSAFTVVANSTKLTSSLGYVELNKLQVGNYKFPNAAGTTGQVLTLGPANTLQFASINSDVVDAGDKYTFSKGSPLFFDGKTQETPDLAFNDLNSGLGVKTTGSNSELFFKLENVKLLALKKPSSPLSGSPTAPYLKFEGPTVLPDFSTKTSSNAYAGSVWYDQTSNSLVLVSNTGNTFIQGQATAASVNTSEAKDFTMNPTASFALGAGSTAAPTFKVGTVGFTGANQDLTLVFDGTAKVKITGTAIEPAQASTGSAKILLDSSIGINNPVNPPYTFAGASQLGFYRSNTNAIGVSVQGSCISEFTATGIDLKNRKLTNVATPTAASDAANKSYIDGKLPTGSTAGKIATYSTVSGKYVQSEAGYSNGILDIGGTATGTLRLNNSNGGSVSLRPPIGIQNLTFTLPASNLANGLLRVNAQGETYWDALSNVTSGLLKADGSIQMTSGLQMANASTKSNLMLAVGTTGMYAQGALTPKIGFASNGEQLMELDALSGTLSGITTQTRSPYIRLGSSEKSKPIYSFESNKNSGLAYTDNGVSVVIDDSEALTVSALGVSANNLNVKNVANPVSAQDAATKAYVDNATKEVVEISFRILTLPSGWTSGNSIILSLADKALIYNTTFAYLEFLPNPFPDNVSVPENFQSNAKCQCYVENARLIKVPRNNVSQVARINNGSLLLNYNLAVNQIITVQLPG